MAEVYIALGTNLGELQQNLREAISYLKAGVKIDKSSGVYETIPAYFENQGNFLNMVVGGTTALAPHELLAFLKQIENKMGRQPT
jgi:2-amino-4-hydroxy-6-hydroxymethyldihydropteridine diphosphokinase